MGQVEVFEEHTERYDRWFDRHRAAYRSELAAVRAGLPEPCGPGLEIGVGSGRFAAPLGVRFGVDPSVAMLRLARERGVATAGGVAEALPVRSGSMDLALMVTTICFLDDEEAAAREMHRILRPGGRAVVGFVDAESHLGKRYREQRPANPFYRGARFVSPGEVTALLCSHGFRDPVFYQTIRGEPERMSHREPVAPGHGDGGFVVVAADRGVA